MAEESPDATLSNLSGTSTYITFDVMHNKHFRLRFGLVYSINMHLRLKTRVIFEGGGVGM